MRYLCSGTAVSWRRIGGIRSSGTAVLPHKNIQYMYELLTNLGISAHTAILLSGMRPIAESDRIATDN